VLVLAKRLLARDGRRQVTNNLYNRAYLGIFCDQMLILRKRIEI
ncbi:unnamed protein product, partial [Acidithrix sp. C25]